MHSQLSIGAPRACFVRSVPFSFEGCLRSEQTTIDVAKAQKEHAELMKKVGRLVDEIIFVPISEEHPDGCFVEDVAIVLDDLAIMTRPGALSRRGEVLEVESVLKKFMKVTHLEAGTLDGGDVMRVANTLFVGRSTRTDSAGVDSLRRICRPLGIDCIEVPVSAELHLKSLCTVVGDNTIVVGPSLLERTIFEERGIRMIEVPERFGANVLPLGTTTLVSSSAPITAEILEAKGFNILRVNVSELHKADGALTCLSLRWPHCGFWCP